MSKHKHAEVIKAWADGETIQFKYFNTDDWIDFRGPLDGNPTVGPWDNECPVDWRIKPKSVTIWVNVYPNLLISSQYTTKEEADERADNSRIACVPLTYTPGEGL